MKAREYVGFLKEQKCDLIQGYYSGKPMPTEEFEKLMQGGMVIAYGTKALCVKMHRAFYLPKACAGRCCIKMKNRLTNSKD